MKSFRFSISRLMAAVVILAVVFGVARWLIVSMPRSFDRNVGEVLVFGALPMGSILAFGLLPILGSRTRQGCDHSRLTGFEMFGGMALLVFVVAAFVAPRSIHDGVDAILGALPLPVNPAPVVRVTVMALIIAILLIPQLAVAMLGARWCGKYRIWVSISVSIEKRQETSLPSGETTLADEVA